MSSVVKNKAMILKMSIECVRGHYLQEPCIRVIEIDDAANLYALHDAIQDAVDFERDHPFGFYVANSSSPCAQKHWISQEEKWERMETEFVRTRLKDIYPLGRKKLYYLFDFGDQWAFEIRKARGAKKPEAGVKYPRVVEAIGPAPEQYPIWEDS